MQTELSELCRHDEDYKMDHSHTNATADYKFHTKVTVKNHPRYQFTLV